MSDDATGEDDPLRMARLAIFCSVFGASILLGVTMSIVRRQPPVRLSQHNLIRLDLVVDRTVGGPTPLVNVVVTPPGSALSLDLPLASLSAADGAGNDLDRSRFIEIMKSKCGFFHTAGLSYFGNDGSSASDHSDAFVIVEAPAAGEWHFGIRLIDVKGSTYDADVPIDFVLRTRVTTNEVMGEEQVTLARIKAGNEAVNSNWTRWRIGEVKGIGIATVHN